MHEQQTCWLCGNESCRASHVTLIIDLRQRVVVGLHLLQGHAVMIWGECDLLAIGKPLVTRMPLLLLLVAVTLAFLTERYCEEGSQSGACDTSSHVGDYTKGQSQTYRGCLLQHMTAK